VLPTAGYDHVVAGAGSAGAAVAAQLSEHPATSVLAADVIWTLGSPETYRPLVTERGWDTDKYQRWLATTLERTPGMSIASGLILWNIAGYLAGRRTWRRRGRGPVRIESKHHTAVGKGMRPGKRITGTGAHIPGRSGCTHDPCAQLRDQRIVGVLSELAPARPFSAAHPSVTALQLAAAAEPSACVAAGATSVVPGFSARHGAGYLKIGSQNRTRLLPHSDKPDPRRQP